MSDLSITAANVVAGSNASIEYGTWGEAIIQGKVVYQDPTTKKLLLADNDAVSADVRGSRGIALNAGSNNQPGAIIKGGDLTVGATLVPGTTYCLSSTAGGICPQADVASGDEVIVLGVAISAAVLRITIQDSGVTL